MEGKPSVACLPDPRPEREEVGGAKRDPSDDWTGLRHFGFSRRVPFSAGDDPIRNPAIGQQKRKIKCFLLRLSHGGGA